MSERTIRQQVIRDRITEESVRKRDAHEIVDWIHGLEDEAAGHEKRIRELEAALRDMLNHSCVADAGEDMKEPEDHEAERQARALLEQPR